MSTQKKLTDYIKLNSSLEKKDIKKIENILNLEKKYFKILYKVFSSKSFKKELLLIEGNIQENYKRIQTHWDLSNKLKVAAERIVRHFIYKKFRWNIRNIYPSPISCDIGLILKDIVLQIDVKTLNTVSNKGDVKNLQFENNQSSFKNINLDVDNSKPNSGVRVVCLLKKEYSYNNEDLPVLTFFVTAVYCDDGESFKLNNEDTLQTIYLKCLPNGYLSPLFECDIVENFKTYTYFNEKDGFERIKLTDDERQINNEVENHISANPTDYSLINGRTRIGAFQHNAEHPKYETKGISWFPVKRKDGIYLEAVNKGNTSRVDNDTLEKRYDSKDRLWYGIKKYKI